MMRRTASVGWVRPAVIVAAAAAAWLGGVARAEQAYLSSQENGQSLIVDRLGQCYAVTPAHVLGKAEFASLTGLNRVMGEADLLQIFGYDLALLHVNGGMLKSFCKDTFRPLPPMDDALTRSASAVVQSLNDDGSVARRRVSLLDHDMLYIHVRPESAADRLFQGLSGSVLVAGEQRIGMLMSVDPATGYGTALRYDRLMETLAPFFNGAASAKSPVAAPAASHAAPSATPLRVVSWSAASKNADSRAENLVSLGAGPWIAEFGGQPVEVVLELNAASPIRSVMLSSEGCDDPGVLARDIEIMGARENKKFLPLGATTLPAKGGTATISFAPARLKFILVRIHNAWQSHGSVALGKVAVQ